MEAQMIDLSKTVLGVELGSTRIKAVLNRQDLSLLPLENTHGKTGL